MSVETAHQRPAPPADDDPLTPSQAAHFFRSAKTGKPIAPAGVIRYILVGKDVGGERRVYLGGELHPGGWRTTPRAIRAFIEAITAARLARRPNAPAATPSAARQRHLADVDSQLDQIGI